MSDRPTLVTDQHFEYVAAHTRRDDAFLAGLKQAAREAGIPPIWVSGEQASFMQVLLKLAHAKTVVEVGTLAGYSAIVMARALPADGHVHTIELEPKHAEFAERWVAKSDVAGRVTVHRGAGMDVLPRFADGSADACFLDADKASYPRYLAECMRIARTGALIMADNAFAFGELFGEVTHDRETPAIRAFNDHVPTVQGLHAVIVPVGDGLWVGVKE
jgi:predicted O-methyltransferase YrrM